MPTPRYLHVPGVRNEEGEKLSKQTGAVAVEAADSVAALATLMDVAKGLNLHVGMPGTLEAFWRSAVPAWAAMLEARGAS